MTQLHDLTLLEQADAVRRREGSPVDLVDHYLARIEHLNDDVGAFVFVAPDQARAAAKDAESALSSGQELPPLHGVPIAIKDLYLTADMPTGEDFAECGSERWGRPSMAPSLLAEVLLLA